MYRREARPFIKTNVPRTNNGTGLFISCIGCIAYKCIDIVSQFASTFLAVLQYFLGSTPVLSRKYSSPLLAVLPDERAVYLHF
jgi:hypothetical protein